MITSRPTFTAVFASTIDGRITDHEGHFHVWGSEEDHVFFQELILQFDAVVVGRITYEHLSKRSRFPKPLFVLTSEQGSLSSDDQVVAINVEQTDLVTELQTRSYKRVLVIGGTKTYSYFLEQRLLDELYVTIEPITFGQGKPAFSHDSFLATTFSLMEMKRLNEKGTILLRYRRTE